MARGASMRVLTVNTGSSSLKAGLFDIGEHGEKLVLSASAERLGGAGGRMALQDAAGATVREQGDGLPDHGAALRLLFGWLAEPALAARPEAIGHRVVHGGTRFMEPTPVSPAMLDDLEKLTPVDPDHLPQAIAGLRIALEAFPELPQVACFDTAFHRHKPAVATIEPLLRELIDEGVVRLGFHGLSYEYVLDTLRAVAPAEAAGRLVIAHLGNGASMVAVRDGVGIETTMGFSPTGGLVMGTRSGDLDPGVLLYLLRSRGLSADALSELVNKRAGLLGVSGTSADMRDLLERERDDPHAAQAVELF
jgi:acetate kinase